VASASVQLKPREHIERPQPRWLRALGPGLITGSADDDPSGIATYSQAGAAYGYALLWSLTLCLPLMIAVQEACARIGAVTGHGLTRVAGALYSRRLMFGVVALVLVANIINIGADIAAVAASVQLLVPLPLAAISIAFVALVVLMEIFIGYHTYAKVLKVFAVALVAYVFTALMVSEPWGEVLDATVVPRLQFNAGYLSIVVAILGTTISPYMFFWQASEEVEEMEDALRSGHPRRSVRDLRTDNAIGMVISQLGSWFMMLTTATVLHAHGTTNIATAADAASALEPLVHTFPHAGTIAKAIFAVGVIGMGLLGIPVLAGSASYAVSEAMGWREGLSLKPSEAKAFYGVLVIATVIGLALTLLGLDPIKLLIFAAVINGVVSVPLIFLVGSIAANELVMGGLASGRLSRIMLRVTFVVVLVAVIAMFVTMATGS